MTAKTRHCAECKHFTHHNYVVPGTVCGLGHMPRFYYAQLDKAWRIPGWKRRCEDFKTKESE